jgi:molybdate/tungstate transport system substrate-binding protein
MGPSNGGYISWYFTFATTQLVIGFDPKSPATRDFRLVQKGKLPWYRALLQKGLRIGRTDPKLDPKGYRALWMARLAAKVFHLKHFQERLFGAAENADQVFPEQVLVARLLTGQVNAGVFYLSEVKDLGIPYITLPARINLGSQKHARLYATQSYTLPSGQKVTGAPIEYTISIPSTVRNPEGATAFVRFVLGSRVRALAKAHGLLPLHVRLTGSRAQVPAGLRSLVGS